MIELSPPNIGVLEQEFMNTVLSSGWVGPDGTAVEMFEERVAAAAGRKWAIATITGTAALHAAAFVLWSRRPRVNTYEAAFPAMANVMIHLGYAGYSVPGGVDHDLAIYKQNDRPNARVIADRAPAIGEPKSDADVECYSFAANKIVTCGHGGAIVGDDQDLEGYIRYEIRQGYLHDGHFNYRMANVNAAIGCAQMERLGELKEAKRRIWNRYRDAGLQMVERGASRWMATISVPYPYLMPRAEVLNKMGIGARAEPAGLSLPCGSGLTEDDQDRVIRALEETHALAA